MRKIMGQCGKLHIDAVELRLYRKKLLPEEDLTVFWNLPVGLVAPLFLHIRRLE